MKTLKLNHKLAQNVLAGTKTSTIRLYDDKDLSVNDTVELIDKVEQAKPATWKAIGTAHIDSIVQKRLDDVEETDLRGNERFTTKKAMIEAFRGYYGPQVDGNTPVKIIQFTFSKATSQLANVDDKKTSYLTEVKLYADGGSRGNPGPSASGWAILDMNDTIVVKRSMYLGITTNNQAEYQALKFGLEEALKMRVQKVHVYMDSLLVVNQMLGTFKVRNRDLWPIHQAIKELSSVFEQVTFAHVPRELNKIADGAVNEALDAAAKHS